MTKREPDQFELAALSGLTSARQLVVAPVLFNGVERFAILVVHEGPVIQVVGILPNTLDRIIPSGEQSASNNKNIN